MELAAAAVGGTGNSRCDHHEHSNQWKPLAPSAEASFKHLGAKSLEENANVFDVAMLIRRCPKLDVAGLYNLFLDFLADLGWP